MHIDQSQQPFIEVITVASDGSAVFTSLAYLSVNQSFAFLNLFNKG